MKNSIPITGLDIGSSKISAVTAEIDKSGAFNIVAQATHPASGIARGAIVDINEAVRSISGTFSRLKKKLSSGMGDIYANISGDTVKGTVSKGMIPISLRGREVTKADIARCVDAASTVFLPFDREIIHRIVHRFSVDNEPPVKSPLGLYASRLECEAYIITAGVSHIQNIYKCVSNAGYDVKEVVFSGIADGVSLLDKDNRKGALIIVGMGSSLTEICSFIDGTPIDIDVLLSGAEDYKSGFRESAHFSDIVTEIRKKLDSLSRSPGNVESVILTGVGSFGDGIAEYMEEQIARSVKMGVVKDVRGALSTADSVMLSTAIGLAKYANEKRVNKFLERGNITSRISTAVVDLFNSYF